jgi:putative transcriptional regulator
MGYVPGRCLLKQILRKKRLRQQWLSDMTGIAKSQISEYSNNKTVMSLPTLMTIAKALNCSMDEIYEIVKE